MLFPALIIFGSIAACGDFGLWVEEDSSANSAPTASFTSSPAVVLPCSQTTVTFNGSGSSDSGGNTLYYGWSLTGPEGSTAELTSTSTSSTNLLPDESGQYSVTLTVFNGFLFGVTTKILTVSSDPIAIAALGDSAVIDVDIEIPLDGSGSMDPDADSCGNSGLTYSWELVAASVPAGAAATLSGESTATPTFQTDTLGQYSVTLTVQNGDSEEDTDTLSISVEATAVAGEDQDEAL